MVFKSETPLANLTQHVNVSSKASCDPHRTNQQGGMTANYVLEMFVCRMRFAKGVYFTTMTNGQCVSL